MLEKILELEKEVKVDYGEIQKSQYWESENDVDYFYVLKKFKMENNLNDYDSVFVKYFKINDGYETKEYIYFGLCHVNASSSKGIKPTNKITLV